MKATLIKKDDSYYLSTEKQTDLCYHLEYKEILKVKGVGENSGEVHHNKGWNKSDEVLFINTEVKLSIKNCDELFGVVDVKKLAEEEFENSSWTQCFREELKEDFIEIYDGGFNKAMELNKDKVFTLENITNAMDDMARFISTKELRDNWENNPTEFYRKRDFLKEKIIQLIQQPTEIEVTFNLDEKDSEGCLILKKI